MLGYLTRGTAFYVLGALLGNFSTRAAHAPTRSCCRREQQLQAILDNSTAIIYLKDREGSTCWSTASSRSCSACERRRRDRQDRPRPLPGVHGGRLPGERPARPEGGRSLEIEEVAPGDGGEHTYISVKFPLHDATGKAYGVCGISTDITARKVAEQALKESKDRVGQIIDGAREAFVSMNQDGEIIAWNRAAEEMFGLARGEGDRQARSRELIIPERYREAHHRGLERFLRTGKGPMLNSRVELLALHRDGSEFPVEVSITAVRVRGGFSFHAFIHDISDRKRLEREVVRLSELRAGV